MGEYIQGGHIMELNEKYRLEYGKRNILNISFNKYLNSDNLKYILCKIGKNNSGIIEVTKQVTYKIDSDMLDDLYKYFDELKNTIDIEFSQWIEDNNVISIKSAKVIKSEDNSEMDVNSLLIHCYIK